MKGDLTSLADVYRMSREWTGDMCESLRGLYARYIKEREQGLLDAAAAAVAVNAIFLTYNIDFSKIDSQMREAWRLAYPNVEVDSLAQRVPQDVQGFLQTWKGKYFEVLARDKLNSGEWIGDLHLGEGQQAVLAESATQPGWDLVILNADGTVAEELQLKATSSLSYAKEALERYPDIHVVGTDEVGDVSFSDHIFSSGMSDEALEHSIREPMEELLDSPLEELAEDVLPFVPFLIIAVGEGRKVMVGRKSFDLAFADGLERAAKTGAAIGVAAVLVCFDLGILSLPAALLVRMGIDEHRIARNLARALDARIKSAQGLLPLYSR